MLQKSADRLKVQNDQAMSLESGLERLQKIYSGIADHEVAVPYSILFIARAQVSQRTLQQEFQYFVQQQKSHLFIVDCLQDGLVSFWPLRQLLEQLLLIVTNEAPDLLNYYAPEISVVHPQLAERLGVHPRLTLAQLALTPSERRIHRESEQAFRIINGICQLLVEAQLACPTFMGKPLVIWFENLQTADYPTLLTFRRLNRWICQARVPLFLVGTLAPGATFSLSYDLPLSPELEHFLDWQDQHDQLQELVRGQLLGEEYHLDEASPQVEENRASGKAVADEQCAADHMALQHFKNGQIEEGCAYAIQAIRSALFMLNLEEVFLLGRHIISLLDSLPDDQFDEQCFVSLWQSLIANDLYVALEFSVAGIHRKRDILIATWKAIALAHTFLEHHQDALDCYFQAFKLADTPEMKAQLNMYMGLVAGKRLHQADQARTFLQRGFEELEGLSSPEGLLERGWLLNVNALMNYQKSRYRDSMGMVQNALTSIRQLHHSEATHLKVNLISNISVLYEDTEHIAQAITTWKFFRSFLGTANEIFAKHYLYREGGLHMKAGDLKAALECMQQSYTQAEATWDNFHGEVVARACGYLEYQLAEFSAAHEWYRKSTQLREKIGDWERLPETLLAQACCAYRLNQEAEAKELLQRAEALCQDLQLPLLDAVHQAQLVLQTATPEALKKWEQQAIVAPNTKLNRPFYLVNPY